MKILLARPPFSCEHFAPKFSQFPGLVPANAQSSALHPAQRTHPKKISVDPLKGHRRNLVFSSLGGQTGA